MMTNQTAGVFVPEGPSLNRPPTFDGKYYYYWKERMKLFLESQDVDLRYCCGWTRTPTTTNAEGASTLKPKDSWTPNKKNGQYLPGKTLSYMCSSYQLCMARLVTYLLSLST